MKKMPYALAIAMVFAALAMRVSAQQGNSSRRILQTELSSIVGQQAVTAVHDYQGSVVEPRHTHPGDLVGYVLEGTVSLSTEGKSTVTLKAGDTFFVPAGAIHNVASPRNARILATYIVEQGKPLALAAP